MLTCCFSLWRKNDLQMDIMTVINLEDGSGSFSHHVRASGFNYHQLHVQKSILTPRDPDIISPRLRAQFQQLRHRKARYLSGCSVALGEAPTGQALGMLPEAASGEGEPHCCKRRFKPSLGEDPGWQEANKSEKQR